jgi:hypothetical protein
VGRGLAADLLTAARADQLLGVEIAGCPRLPTLTLLTLINTIGEDFPSSGFFLRSILLVVLGSYRDTDITPGDSLTRVIGEIAGGTPPSTWLS